jgi:hypothetical protein
MCWQVVHVLDMLPNSYSLRERPPPGAVAGLEGVSICFTLEGWFPNQFRNAPGPILTGRLNPNMVRQKLMEVGPSRCRELFFRQRLCPFSLSLIVGAYIEAAPLRFGTEDAPLPSPFRFVMGRRRRGSPRASS